MARRYAFKMRVRVLFFGVLRDHQAEQWLELPPAACTVADLLEQLRGSLSEQVQALLPRVAVAVNRCYACGSHTLADGDEVALLPPVSGGADAGQVRLTTAPLDGGAALAALKAGSDGAVVVFDGIVRNNTRGRQTEYLIYEAYEAMALEKMCSLVDEACDRFQVRDALLHHRLGRLEIGESSVLIAVASAHRAAAFDACRWMIDTLKKTVPIWKKEFFVDGAVWADGEPFPDALRPEGSSREERS